MIDIETLADRLRSAGDAALGHIKAASCDHMPDANLEAAEAILTAALQGEPQ